MYCPEEGKVPPRILSCGAGLEPSGRGKIGQHILAQENQVSHGPRWVALTYFGPERPVWLVQDQPFVNHKYDVLTWVTDTLRIQVGSVGRRLPTILRRLGVRTLSFRRPI
jgi:hypothetical protein